MVVYVCSKCGNKQQYDGECSSCHLWAMQMKMLDDARKINETTNMAIYGDDGCCGCNEKKRRNMAYIIAVALVALGVGFIIFGEESQRDETGIPLIVLGGIFGITGFCCPNGCCGEYSRNNQANQID